MIEFTCDCGKRIRVKDELAGKRGKCKQCGATIRVPRETAKRCPYCSEPMPSGDAVACPTCGEYVEDDVAPGESQQPLDPAFSRDKFLLQQKRLSFGEKYYVLDERSQEILFVQRPGYGFYHLGVLIVALVAGYFVNYAIDMLSFFAPDALMTFFGFASFFGGVATVMAVFMALKKKRHVKFYKDDSKQRLLLEVLEDKKFTIPIATYTVNDADGNLLARFRKNHLYNIYRRRWNCYGADGSELCVAMEDSFILALLRRFLGSLFGLLRTNFIIVKGEKHLGSFNRKFTLRDCYVLDMTSDRKKKIDRRIAIALGVMLDTGENR